jgi:prophage regulatory protein
MHQLPDVGFLRLPQIIGDRKRNIPPLIPISRSSWWMGIRNKKYPKGVKLGPRTTVWRAEDIQALIANPDLGLEGGK